MYVPYRQETLIDFKLPWDSNTARGFAIALSMIILLIFFISFWKVEKATYAEYESKTIPLELINFGAGDGTGMSKGNLSKEGMAHQGSTVSSDLEDASIAAKTKYNKDGKVDDPTGSQKMTPVNLLSSNDKNSKDMNGTGSKNIGKPNGTPDGKGIGDKGYGPGAGEGFGDIEWGGGGNRVVLQKKLPRYPQGVNTGAQIRIRFTVSQDGTVTSMIPLQKGDPMLERAALDALRQWRFNRLKDNKDMYGIITFTFRLS